MVEWFKSLFFDALLMLHAPGYLQTPGAIWLQVSSHSLIALFYYSIFILLIYVPYQRGTLPYAGIIVGLGTFTLASGTHHLMKVGVLWHPNSWLAVAIEMITVVMAAIAALLVVQLLPKILAEPRSAKMQDLLKAALNINSVSAATLTSGESALPSNSKTLPPTPNHPFNTKLEQRFNTELAVLQRNNEQLQNEIDGQKRWSEELSLLQSLTQVISEAPDFQSALVVALRQVCEVTHWDYGEAWFPGADNTVLECSPAWYGRTPTWELFRQTRETLKFSPNTGLPGQVWTSQQPQWVEGIAAQCEVTCDSEALLRLRNISESSSVSADCENHYDARLGWFSVRSLPLETCCDGIGCKQQIADRAEVPELRAFAVPILVGERVLAVLTFFTNQSRPTDQRWAEVVTAVATQLGLVIQRKQLEEDLRQERDFTKTLIETSSAFFVAFDAKGRTIMINQEFLKAVGYTLDEVLGADFLSMFARQADRKIFLKGFKQLVKLRQPTLKETHILTKKGRELLVEWRGRPIFKPSGELDFFFGVGIDITQRKQLEQELRQSEERYRAIIEEQTELICRFLADGTLTFVNDAYCRYFGKTRDELLGSSLFQAIPDEYRETTQKHITTLSLRNPVATRNYQAVTPNGENHWLQWTDQVIVDREGQVVEFQSVGRDITERQLSVKESARLASMPLLSPNPIVETDLEGRVRYLNPEAMRLLPDLQERGPAHPFVAGIPSLAGVLQRKGSIRREVKIGEVYYEQELHYLEEIECFRIYAFDVSDRKQVEQQLIHNAFYDQLTGLPNRALFMDRLKQAIQRSKQSRNSDVRPEPYRFAVLFLNLNRFKLVNDSLGSYIGDQLLQSFAGRLQKCLHPTDTVARLGADEFAILLEGIQDVSDATRAAESINQTLASPFCLSDREIFMTLNIGIALSTSDDEQPEDLLRNADLAMYRARAQGKAYYEVFDAAMHKFAVERLQLETDLRRAVERQEFRVYYQPIVSLATGRIIGFEALLRWQHPERGLVSPNDFISTAEETGLISPIGWWTLQEACRQLSEWQEQFPSQPPLTMNVNLSCKQFTQSDLLTQIDSILKENQLAIGSLKLEITESVVMENPDWVRDVLLELKKRKIHLCIDDFGTGYSSLSRLHHFPISTLKIDRSFISRIGALGENSEIIQAIVTLAQTLSMDVVAEGIEVSEQVSPLLALQCEYGQGYFFSRPVDSEAARVLLMAEWEQRHEEVDHIK
jgi:diguanylate cyclase (GGDEF)-like protein/PAS domain S-box-containing protein